MRALSALINALVLACFIGCSASGYSAAPYAPTTVVAAAEHGKSHRSAPHDLNIHLIDSESIHTATMFSVYGTCPQPFSRWLSPPIGFLSGGGSIDVAGYLRSCLSKPGSFMYLTIGPIYLLYDCTIKITQAPSTVNHFRYSVKLDAKRTGHMTSCSLKKHNGFNVFRYTLK